MSIWIRTQNKTRLLEIESIQWSGKKIKGFSPLHPLGITLAKYRMPETASSTMDALQEKIKSEPDYHFVFEMPGEL